MGGRQCSGPPFSNHEGIHMQTAVLESRSTTAKPAAKKRSAPLDPQVADRLLDLLSTDDTFRQLFQTSPRQRFAALATCLGSNLMVRCFPASD